MKSYKSFLFAILLPAMAFSGCYHQFPKGGGGGGGTTGGGGGSTGSAFVNFTVTSTPSQTFSFPSLVWQILSIQFVTSTGGSIGVGGTASPLPLPDLNRLQTDSIYMGHAEIPAGTYSSVIVSFGTPLFGEFYNSTNATVLGCASGLVCIIPSTVPGYGASSVTVPFTFTATGGANVGVTFNIDLSKAVTSAGGMTFDFTQTGAIVPSVLPRKGSQTSGIDTLENFTGTVTATTSTTVTVAPNGAVAKVGVFTMASNVEFDDPFTICTGTAGFSCLAVNQNVSVDGILNADGTMTAYEVEFIDPAPLTNELEGVIISPVSNNSFKIALANELGPGGLIESTPVIVNLNTPPTFLVDPKNLGISTSPLGFQSQTDLVLGQTVMLQGGTINDSNTSLNNPTRVLLRYSSIGGVVQAPSNPVFTLSTVSPFFVNLINNTVEVQTFPTTTFDNITGISGLTTGTNASVRALYLNPTSGATPPVLASQVRTH